MTKLSGLASNRIGYILRMRIERERRVQKSSRRARVKEELLRLLSTGTVDPPIGLNEAEWAELAEIARQHLLTPMLHYLINQEGRRSEVPVSFRESFATDYRHSAITALKMQTTLYNLDGLFRANGIPYVALKGARIAWHAYPHPAMRPMRDLDILVSAEAAEDSFGLLLANGCRRYADRNRPVAWTIQYEKHLPPIWDGSTGVQIELHTRLFKPELASDPEAALLKTDELLERRIELPFPNGAVAFLPAEEALVHCIAHAVYDSRLTSGPILLSDLFYILRRESIDWSRFWKLAEQGGWTPGCRLALSLLEAVHGRMPIEWRQSGNGEIPDEMLRNFAFALMSDKSAMRDMFIQTEKAVEGAQARALFYAKLLFPAKYQLQDFGRTPSVAPWVWALYPAWLLTRIIGFLASLANRRQRTEVAGIKQILAWLNSTEG